MRDNEKWAYRVGEVADKLQISKSLAWRLVLNGSWPSIKIGRTRRITANTVKQLLAEDGGGRRGRK